MPCSLSKFGTLYAYIIIFKFHVTKTTFLFTFRNLGNNIFPNLPTNGLNRLLHLKTFNNPKLREFPSPEVFPRIQTLVLSYAYHCCPFLPLVAMSQTSKTPQLFQEAVLFPSDSEFDMSLWNNSLTDIWPQLRKTLVFKKPALKLKTILLFQITSARSLGHKSTSYGTPSGKISFILAIYQHMWRSTSRKTT